MDQAIAAQQAQAATAGGAFNPAILRQQQQQLATATQQTAGQAAAISAQEQQKAMETAAQALAQQRSIESQEQQLTTNLNAEIAKGNFNAANALVQQKQEQRFAGISQQADAINKAVQQGQIDAAKAAELNAQLQTQVELQNSDLAFKASQGDQAAQLEIDALNAQNIDNMMKMGYTYDAAKLQADQYWTSLVTAGRELQANTALGVYDAKRRIDAARAGRAESSGGGGFMDSLMNVGLQVGAGVLTKKLSGDSSGGPKQEQSPSKMGEPAAGGHVTSGKVTNNEQRMAFGGVITQNFACGGTVRPRINMAVGGAVPPPAVASGGPAVHPSILEQQQPTAPVATDTMAAPVPGDSPQNDVVPAQLSPGEIVIPRSAVASGRGGIMSFIDALDKEGKLGEAQAISSTPSYGEVLQAKQKIKKV
jgi:hypothetical protein